MLTLEDMNWFTLGMAADKIRVPADDYRGLKRAARDKLCSGMYVDDEALKRKGLAINGVEITKGAE